MVFKKDVISFIKVIIIGILAGALCAVLDLFPPDLWCFSSFSGSLGFWALSGMIILMQSDTRILAGINTFLYFAFMNASFFFVYLLLPIEFPRIQTFSQACLESLVWTIPSLICGVCALIAYEAKKDDWKGIIALALPIGLMLHEFVQVVLSVFIIHKYLFQTLVDLFGMIILFILYKGKKKKLYLVISSIIVAVLLLGYIYIRSHVILYY